MREIRIKHNDEELQDPQRITHLNQRLLAAEFDGDIEAIHKHEIHEIIDDFDTGERILKIRKRKFFVQGTSQMSDRLRPNQRRDR